MLRFTTIGVASASDSCVPRDERWRDRNGGNSYDDGKSKLHFCAMPGTWKDGGCWSNDIKQNIMRTVFPFPTKDTFGFDLFLFSQKRSIPYSNTHTAILLNKVRHLLFTSICPKGILKDTFSVAKKIESKATRYRLRNNLFQARLLLTRYWKLPNMMRKFSIWKLGVWQRYYISFWSSSTYVLATMLSLNGVFECDRTWLNEYNRYLFGPKATMYNTVLQSRSSFTILEVRIPIITSEYSIPFASDEIRYRWLVRVSR